MVYQKYHNPVKIYNSSLDPYKSININPIIPLKNNLLKPKIWALEFIIIHSPESIPYLLQKINMDSKPPKSKPEHSEFQQSEINSPPDTDKKVPSACSTDKKISPSQLKASSLTSSSILTASPPEWLSVTSSNVTWLNIPQPKDTSTTPLPFTNYSKTTNSPRRW